MVDLNLIPSDYRRQIGLRRLGVLIKQMIMWLMLYTIIVATILLIAKLMMQLEFQNFVDETTLVTRENKQVLYDIAKLNDLVRASNDIQKQEVDWANFILKLSNLVPEGVRLTDVTLSNGSKSSILGMANSREALLTFKQNLESQTEFKVLELPISDLLKREDIEFSFSFIFNLRNIK